MPIRDIDINQAHEFDQHGEQQKIADKEFQKIQEGIQARALWQRIRSHGSFFVHSFSG
jgi:hypothetical protein